MADSRCSVSPGDEMGMQLRENKGKLRRAVFRGMMWQGIWFLLINLPGQRTKETGRR